MMKRTILYYPTIAIPPEWIRFSILYWDQISSIVPKSWEEKMVDSKIDAFSNGESYKIMQFLRDEGCYEPIRPENETVHLDVDQEFEAILKSQRFQSKLPPMLYREKLLHKAQFMGELQSATFGGIFKEDLMRDLIGSIGNYFSRVHKDKTSKDIMLKLLVDNGLAIEDYNNPDWYIVERNTSLLYMAILAKHLSYTKRDYTIIGTDWEEYESLLFESYNENVGFPSITTKMLNILPVPRSDVRIEQILKFKREKEDELLKFRFLLDEFESELSHAENENQMKHIMITYKERIELDVSNLKKYMKYSDIKATMESFKSLIDIKKPVLWESLALSLGSPPTAIIPLLGITAAIQIGLTWIDNKNEKMVRARNSPYSYLYYAKNARIIGDYF